MVNLIRPHSFRRISQSLLNVRLKLASTRCYGITVGDISPQVKNIEYALMGPLLMRSVEIKKELENGIQKPYKNVISLSAGDLQGNGQLPITFLRQVVALCSFPRLFHDSSFPDDAKLKAKRILQSCNGNTIGSYGMQAGLNVVRSDIVNYIEDRDGLKSNIDDVIVTTGASEGMDYIINMIGNRKQHSERPGIMLPIPGYPLYTSYTAKHDVHNIFYYLDEEKNWNFGLNELERSIDEGKNISVPKVIVVINPGNPAGQLLDRNVIENVIYFAKKHNLTIVADEVYQKNVFTDKKFVSFKKVLHDMGSEFSDVEILSLMSASKGLFGECGFRGGYLEFTNTDNDVRQFMLTNLSTRTCAPILGQVALDVVVNPPKPGDQSYDLFNKEETSLFTELKSNAQFLSHELNKIPGYSSNEIAGAIYIFPRITIPKKAETAAKEQGLSNDEFYCLRLLEDSGIFLMPGSPFGQYPGTYHLRLSLGHKLETLQEVITRVKYFQTRFMDYFS